MGTLAGFSAGDKVLIVQMQVPQVDLSNSANFGALLNTSCIGNYEFNRIQSLGGNTIQLQFGLIRAYDVSGKVQLVHVPEYDSATICNLTCLPWNGITGGVLALDVKNNLTLAGNMEVSGKGFRGGVVEPNNIPWVFGEQQYFYPPASTLAAQKGEGLVAIPTDQSYGRGRAGNGGGGGNAHNGGGGGGGNAGAGGDGGFEITNLPATPTPNTNGIGGAGYFDTDVTKVLLGGGGGAGHANDSRGSSGGTGGGIIFVQANTLQTNNFSLLSNGVDVLGGVEQNDGQGGGGGGGTIVLDIGQINGLLPCELTGGQGGSNPYTPPFQLHGPGGGGGGGKLLLSQNSPNVIASLQGGINGLTSQGLTHGAMGGGNGKILTNFVLPESITPAHPVSNNMVLTVQSPACAGTATGQIGVSQSTALAFQLNGGAWQTDSVFTNLTPGTYQIGLQFSGGCTLDTTATLVAVPPVADTLLWRTNPTCTIGGAIAVAAISGTAPFEFQLNNGAWQSSGIFTDLPPGNYDITLRDASGCTHADTYVLEAPPPANDSLLTISPATCVMGGTLMVAAVSGTAPFEFQVNGGPWQTSGAFTDLPAGNYSIQLRDAAGCTDAGNYTIEAPPPANDSLLSINHATCLVGGMIMMTAVSGTAPFEFQVNSGPWQSSGAFTDLPAGNYSIQLRDAAGCTHTDSYTIEAPPPANDSLLSISHATCLVGGALMMTAVSGTAPFEFQVNNGPWQSNGAFNDLPAGNYSIQLRDAAGCTDAGNYTIEAPPPANDSLLSISHATCLVGGALMMTAVSGTAPFEFQVNGGPWQSSGAFSDLPAGNYSIQLRDAAGCTDAGNYTIEAPPPANDSLLSINHATCLVGGAITVTAVSGTAPFEFQVNNGPWQSNGVFSDLPAGNYSIQLRDAAGCTDTGAYTIEAPPPVSDSLLSISHATCLAGGAITVTAVSGTAPFVFQVNGGLWQSSATFNNLPAGNYSIQLHDAAGCTDTGAYTIEAPPPVSDSLLSISHATCLVGGAITVTAVSGTAPFEFQVNGGAWQSSGMFGDLMPGNYTITMQDSAGCVHGSDFELFAPPALLDSLIFVSDVVCDSLGALSIVAVSGSAPVQFQINNGPWYSTGFFGDLPSGNYTVTARDAAGCTHSSSYSIKAYEPLRLQLDSLGAVDCRHAMGYIGVSANGGAGDYSFQLGAEALGQTSGYFPALAAGLYTVVVTDSAGCHAMLEDLAVTDLIDSAVTKEVVTIYEGGYFQLPDGARATRSGQYSFTYQTAEGCDSLHLIDLIVLKRHVYVPNVFSPGSDGQNDYFTVFSDASLEKVDQLLVFDRWGELVFKKVDFSPNLEAEGWDGNFRGRPVNPGMFVWMAQLTFVDGLQRTLSGDVTVVR